MVSWRIAQKLVATTTTMKISRLENYVAVMWLKSSREKREKSTQVGLKHHFRAWAFGRFDLNDRS